MGLLEQVVFSQQARPHKGQAGMPIHLTLIDLETKAISTYSHEVPWQAIVISTPVHEERARELITHVQSLGEEAELRPYGQLFQVQARLSHKENKNRLRRDFVMQRSRKLTMRTTPVDLNWHSFQELKTLLSGLQETFPDIDLAYRPVEVDHTLRLEFKPLTRKQFTQVVPAIKHDRVLANIFQIHELRSPYFDTQEEAHRFMEGCIRDFNEVPYDNDFRLIEAPAGLGKWKTRRFYVRSFSTGKFLNELETAGFTLNGFGCHQDNLDPAQQDEQRNFWEATRPAFRKYSKAPLTKQEIARLEDILLDNTAAVDTETYKYVKGMPAPSGKLVKIILRSRREKLLFVDKAFAPQENEINGYTLVRCDDELDLVQRFNAKAQEYLLLTCHNMNGFDRFQFTKFNKPLTERAVEERFELFTRHYDKKTPAELAAWKRNLTYMRRRSQLLRARHGLKSTDKIFEHPYLFDTLDFIARRGAFQGSNSLEALTGLVKRTGYERQDQNYADKTPEGLYENALYATEDGDATWDVFRIVLPTALHEGAATGRPLHLLHKASLFQNMKKRKSRDQNERGTHLYEYSPRRKVQVREERQIDALAALRTTPLVDPHEILLRNEPMFYHPLVLRTLAPSIAQKEELRRVGRAAQHHDPLVKILTYQSIENYFSEVIDVVNQALCKHPEGLAVQLSKKQFNSAINQFFARNPEKRLAALLRLDHDFSLYDVYKRLQDTYEELQGLPAAQQGPFLFGAKLAEHYPGYYLGQADAVVLKDRLIAVCGERPIIYGTRFYKKTGDLRVRILDAIRTGEFPEFGWNERPRLKKAFERAYVRQGDLFAAHNL